MTKFRNPGPKNKEPPADESSQFISLTSQGQTRAGLRVTVEPMPELELQTFDLADVIQECQHVTIELLANLISLSDTSYIKIEDFKRRGSQLIKDVVQKREPQAVDSMTVGFHVDDQVTEYGVFTTLRFTCGVCPLLASTVKNNGGLSGYVH
jgi:hypothetical protein